MQASSDTGRKDIAKPQASSQSLSMSTLVSWYSTWALGLYSPRGPNHLPSFWPQLPLIEVERSSAPALSRGVGHLLWYLPSQDTNHQTSDLSWTPISKGQRPKKISSGAQYQLSREHQWYPLNLLTTFSQHWLQYSAPPGELIQGTKSLHPVSGSFVVAMDQEKLKWQEPPKSTPMEKDLKNAYLFRWKLFSFASLQMYMANY